MNYLYILNIEHKQMRTDNAYIKHIQNSYYGRENPMLRMILVLVFLVLIGLFFCHESNVQTDEEIVQDIRRVTAEFEAEFQSQLDEFLTKVEDVSEDTSKLVSDVSKLKGE